ncbi:Fur family transcriptional regulator [Streptomyces sp. NPDC051740]|uniref:Fur family transcriptional regulator n=1 Tax=Streptomyces sp. NPDC051740 TaxID=3365673 RepID=UPI00378AF961
MRGTARGEWRTAPRRAAVLEAPRGWDDFVPAQSPHAAPAADGTAVGLTTVCRTLRSPEAAGQVDVVRDSGGERFHRTRPDEGHRHHLVCRVCGLSPAVGSGEVEERVAGLARDVGFHAVDHTVELTGVCDGCRPGTVGSPNRLVTGRGTDA